MVCLCAKRKRAAVAVHGSGGWKSSTSAEGLGVLEALGVPDRVEVDMVVDCLNERIVTVSYRRHIQVEVGEIASHGLLVMSQSRTVCDRWSNTAGRTGDSPEVNDKVPVLDSGLVSRERLELKLQCPASASTIIRAVTVSSHARGKRETASAGARTVSG
jgi:hypothetical protein